MKTKLFSICFWVVALFAPSLSLGQIEIGSNPATISADINLEVEATNGDKTVFKQDNGFVGIGTITPTANLQVQAGNLSVSNAVDNTFLTERSAQPPLAGTIATGPRKRSR